MNLQKFALSSVCFFGLGIVAIAQEPQKSPTQPDQNTQSPRDKQNPRAGGQTRTNQNERAHATTGESAKSADKMIAECLALANQEEVILGKFAQERSQNSAVKEFAKMMVENHQSMLQKLQSFAPEASQAGFLNESSSTSSDSANRQRETNRSNQSVREGQDSKSGVAGQRNEKQQAQDRNENRRDAGQAENRTSSEGEHSLDLNKLHRELAEQCIADTKANLSKKEGKEFDECYVGTQIVKHAGMLSTLTVFQRHASGELKQVINQGMGTTKKHLQHAENLIEQIKGKAATASAAVTPQNRKE